MLSYSQEPKPVDTKWKHFVLMIVTSTFIFGVIFTMRPTLVIHPIVAMGVVNRQQYIRTTVITHPSGHDHSDEGKLNSKITNHPLIRNHTCIYKCFWQFKTVLVEDFQNKRGSFINKVFLVLLVTTDLCKTRQVTSITHIQHALDIHSQMKGIQFKQL